MNLCNTGTKKERNLIRFFGCAPINETFSVLSRDLVELNLNLSVTGSATHVVKDEVVRD